LLKRFAANPDVEKARAEFDRAQKVEEKFHKDFDGQDFARDSLKGGAVDLNQGDFT
jgi:hypothetical protein